MTIKTSEVRCCELISRRWEASHPKTQGVVGVGKTSAEAVKNLRKEIRKKKEKDLQNIYLSRFTFGIGEGS